MAGFNDFVSSANDTVGLLQNGLNFLQDLGDHDYKQQRKSVNASQQGSYNFNMALGEQQQMNNVFNMGLAQRYNQANMRLAQQFNEQNMASQYAINDRLSSRARDVFQARMSGLNPAELTASYQGSIGLPASSPSSSSPLGSSLGSVGSPGSSPVTGFSGLVGQLAQVQLMEAQKDKLRSEKNLSDIDAMTRLQENYSRINKNISEIERNKAEKGYLTAEEKTELSLLQYRKEKLQTEIDTMTKNAESNSVQAEASKKQAENAEKQVNENIRHNKVMEFLGSQENSIKQQGINIQAEQISSVIARNFAEADRLTEAGKLDRETAKNIAQRMLSEIARNMSESEQAHQNAKKLGLDVETYKMRMAAQLAKDYAQAFESTTKGVNNIVDCIPLPTKLLKKD